MNMKSWLVFLAVVSGAMGVGYYQSQHKDAVAQTDENAAPLQAERVTLRVPVAPQKSAGEDTEVRRDAVLMGCEFVFVVDAPQAEALAAIEAASNRIKDLEQTISSWRPASDIARLNESAGIREVVVSADTMTLLKQSKAVTQETGGAFDITIGPVWNLWPFARKDRTGIPSDEEIRQQLALVGSDNLVLDDTKHTAFLTKKGMYVNLGAIGKGYAADLGIQIMKERGIKRAAISASGDIYLLGTKQSGPWVVDIEHPRWEGRTLEKFVAGDVAIATSGDAKQYVMHEGKRYGHILNPATGLPVDHAQSVTIVATNATLADAYATAVYVMGPQKGIEWVNARNDIQALVVDAAGIKHKSRGWQTVIR